MSELNNDIIAVVGLGYVGLPLAVEFEGNLEQLGLIYLKIKLFIIKFYRPNGEVEKKQFQNAKFLPFPFRNILQKLI